MDENHSQKSRCTLPLVIRVQRMREAMEELALVVMDSIEINL